MKLLNFEHDSKKYCLVKQDSNNFCVLEYLPKPKEIVINGKVSVNEFYPPLQYYGSLEYALRKLFRVLGKDYIKKEDYSLFCTSYTPLKSIFELKPYEVTADNVVEVRELIKKVVEYAK